MATTTITSKGQVTIPKHIRDSLSLHPGSEVVFDVNDAGEVVLRKSGPAQSQGPDRFDRAVGAAGIKLGCTVDEYMAMIRDYDK
jgi:AbrB family looped-hinge helix DNA binding protein